MSHAEELVGLLTDAEAGLARIKRRATGQRPADQLLLMHFLGVLYADFGAVFHACYAASMKFIQWRAAIDDGTEAADETLRLRGRSLQDQLAAALEVLSQLDGR
jgi:hypothetical protein